MQMHLITLVQVLFDTPIQEMYYLFILFYTEEKQKQKESFSNLKH